MSNVTDLLMKMREDGKNVGLKMGAGGALTLIDTMIRIQGVEKTVEDIRDTVKYHPTYGKALGTEEKAWTSLLTGTRVMCVKEKELREKKEGEENAS